MSRLSPNFPGASSLPDLILDDRGDVEILHRFWSEMQREPVLPTRNNNVRIKF